MLKKILCFALLMIILVIGKTAYADTSAWEKLQNNMDQTRKEAGYVSYDEDAGVALPTLIGNVIKIILSFIGAIYLFMIIIAGWQWLFSGGNEEKTGAAMKRITHSTIGLIIVLAAYLLTDFITTVFIAATGVGK